MNDSSDKLHAILDAMSARKFREALRLAGAGARRDPGNADYWHLAGACLLELGTPSQAIPYLNQGIRLAPGTPDFHLTLARAHTMLGDRERAIQSIELSLDAPPDDAEVLQVAGQLALNLGAFNLAVRALGSAISTLPTGVSRVLLASALRELGMYEAALHHCRMALQDNASDVEALCCMGEIHCDTRNFQPGLTFFRNAYGLAPDSIRAQIGIAETLSGLERFSEAQAVIDKLIADVGDDPRLMINKGNILLEAGYPEEALRQFDIAGRYASAINACIEGKVAALMDLGRDSEALSIIDLAGRTATLSNEISFMKSLLLLRRGMTKDALELYEYRLSRKRTGLFAPNLGFRESLDDLTTVVLRKEQGLGDQIFFMQHVATLATRREKVVVEIEDRLLSFYRRNFPSIEFVNSTGADPAFNQEQELAVASVPLLLLRKYGASALTEAARHRTKARADLVQISRSKLKSDEKPLIGLAWRSFGRLGSNKSLNLSDCLAAFEGINVRIVSLQYGDVAHEMADAKAQFPNIDFHIDSSPNEADLELHAATIAACDGIFMVPNTSAHLAGSLGAKGIVCVTNSRSRLWFWDHVSNGRSAWYPSLVIENSGRDLREIVKQLMTEIQAN